MSCSCDKEKLYNSGILVETGDPRRFSRREQHGKIKKAVLSSSNARREYLATPCATSCPTGAVRPFEDINDNPSSDYSKCTGCGLCVAKCPGLET